MPCTSSTATRSSASLFSRNATPDGTTASSPLDTSNLEDGNYNPEVEIEKIEEHEPDIATIDEEEKLKRLAWLLEKSSSYANMLKENMDAVKEKSKAKAKAVQVGQKRRRGGAATSSAKRVSDAHEEVEETPALEQPRLVTGANLKPYQLEGVAWMISLWENGISGILADEMGLGKTLQTIAFHAYLREKVNSQFLIVCPLSVLHNWVDEFQKFAPLIPVCMYHGTPAERAEMRRTVMRPVLESDSDEETPAPTLAPPPKRRKAQRKSLNTKVTRRQSRVAPRVASEDDDEDGGLSPLRRKSTRQVAAKRSAPRKSALKTPVESDDENLHDPSVSADDDADKGVARRRTVSSTIAYKRSRIPSRATTPPDSEDEAVPRSRVRASSEEAAMSATQPPQTFPVVITTYEMIIKDRQYLAPYRWGYIVVDEGHRLKNFDCKLMQEIKKYTSAGRMILTGTPLHNNLAELWSLLNFILPDIFGDLNSFQQWFNLPAIQNNLDPTRSSDIINALHGILKPFLLRRLKADVELSLPPKKEYVLYAPLTERQKNVYSAVVDGGLRRFLIDGKHKAEHEDIEKRKDEKKKERVMSGGRQLRRRSAHANYDLDGDDDEYFDKLEAGEFDKDARRHEDPSDLAREHHYKSAVKQVNGLKLQNAVMQLRKVCSHPFLFDWPLDDKTQEPVVDQQLVQASGKMMVLDRLLEELFRRGHKVLLFSQFTTMLDIIEAWVEESKGWRMCRIDGTTPPLERREQMNIFQQGGDTRDAPRLFLLSTRAGGLGINLTAADTVIFYDQDWNPQMDMQAQDRAHRIGQTKPVLVFRLLSAHTIETRIMQRATEKRQLEALVIAKGTFKTAGSLKPRGKENMAELAAELLKLDGEKIEVVPSTEAGKASVISDHDLDVLLDRSPAVFSDRGQGWTSACATRTNAKGSASPRRKTAFEVFDARIDEGNDALARMMGEDDLD